MPEFHSLKVKEIVKETNDTVSVSFQVPEDLKEAYAFTPGQYLTLKLTINNEEQRRSYSICSSSAEDITVAVKRVENGLVSSYLNEVLKENDEMEVMTPEGNFTLETDQAKKRKFVGFAAGSGITPIMSMIKELSMDETETVFTLFYSNKMESDVIFKHQLDKLAGDNLKINYIYTRQKLNNPLLEGRIDKSKATELIKADLSCLNADAFYLCGPEEMIFNVKSALEEFGVLNTKIKFELFTTPVLMAEKPKQQEADENFDGEALVTVIYDDEEIDFNLNKDGDTILDAAMDNDVDVPFSCKGAVCCTCKAKVTEGKVTMDANYALSDQEVEDGYVLACQSHPASAKVTLDFD
ncbi:2Fe-2S iron-sulfur cluster-binding protein [Bacteroidota bacterium]|nr:2Fe-2S iron-sulfur cluster-binding protein [Bacteroidota bacterium]|tara:strand:- start:546 stop:1604 length:1059 start_codon:yes stop_codon:yes gene_type:complete